MSETIVTDATYPATLEESTGPAFLYVWAPWCGPCRMVQPHYAALAQEHKDEAVFWKANLEDFEQVAGDLGIQTTPTLVAYRDGVEVARRSGAVMKAQLASWVGQHLTA